MKIAIFTPYNIFLHGGVQEHVQYQANILRSRGHDVTILTPRPRLKTESDAPEGTKFLGVSARIKTPSATSSDVSGSVDNELIDEVLEEDYDIIHAHEPLLPMAGKQLLMRANEKAIRVGTFHAALPGNTLGKTLVNTYRTYSRTVMPHVDVVTAVSPAAIGFIENYTDKEINYIPNGIHLDAFKPTHEDRDENMVLFIGRLEKRKGARQAIKAFAVLKQSKPKAKLVICGDGPLRKSLQQYVRDNEIEDVEFKGYITEDEKISLLNKCAVYTSPALYGESFGIVLVEAMAMCAPIVCHFNEGYKWTMRDTGRLSLVDCKDPVEYADRLQLIMEDKDLRDVWQKWACEYVKQFDYVNIVDSYEKLYKKSLKKAK